VLKTVRETWAYWHSFHTFDFFKQLIIMIKVY